MKKNKDIGEDRGQLLAGVHAEAPEQFVAKQVAAVKVGGNIAVLDLHPSTTEERSQS